MIAFTFTASSFVLNDYFDYNSDEINSPWRPIPSGRITRNNALNYAILLFFVGSITSLLISPAAALVAFITFIATTFYTFIGKSHGLIGNILVALISPSNLIFGAFTISLKVDHLLAGVFLICFLYVLGGELAQSIADAEGDKIANVKSITLVKGPKTAAILASACYIMVAIIGAFTSFFALSLLPFCFSNIAIILCQFS